MDIQFLVLTKKSAHSEFIEQWIRLVRESNQAAWNRDVLKDSICRVMYRYGGTSISTYLGEQCKSYRNLLMIPSKEHPSKLREIYQKKSPVSSKILKRDSITNSNSSKSQQLLGGKPKLKIDKLIVHDLEKMMHAVAKNHKKSSPQK